MHATMLVSNENGGRGTGFLMAKAVGPDQVKVYLVTNKHVLDEDATVRKGLSWLDLGVNAEKGGSIVGETVRYELADPVGAGPRWRDHLDDDIDVLAVDVTPLFVSRPDLRHKWVTVEMVAQAAERADHEITAGDEVVVVGYPIGMRQGATNYPIVRQGMIATRIGEEFVEEVETAPGKLKQRRIRGFLIDGATIPGSSGSPVVLKPVSSRVVKGTNLLGPPPPLLLGIIAETRFAPVRIKGGSIPGFAGLGLAFDSETIVETVDLF